MRHPNSLAVGPGVRLRLGLGLGTSLLGLSFLGVSLVFSPAPGLAEALTSSDPLPSWLDGTSSGPSCVSSSRPAA